MESQTFDLNELFTATVAADVMKESNAFRTLPADTYRLTIEAREGRIAGPNAPWPGAKMVHLQVAAVNHVAKGKLFFDISFDNLRRQDGTVDKPTKLAAQYAKALGIKPADDGTVNAGATLEAMALYPTDGFVTEVAVYEGQGENGRNKYVTVKNDGDRAKNLAAHQAAGADLTNFIQNIRAPK